MTIDLALFNLCGLTVALIAASLVTGEPDANVLDEVVGEWVEPDW